MAINFPNSPSVGQLYEFNDKTWRWSGDYWEVFSAQTGYISGAISSGSGESVYSGQSGSTIVLRSISGGTNTNVTTVGNLLKIDVTSTTEDLQNTLAAGNTTGGNNITMSSGDAINSANGGGIITLDDGGVANSIAITTDNGSYLESWQFMDGTSFQLGFGSSVYATISSSGYDFLKTDVNKDVFVVQSGRFGYLNAVETGGYTNVAGSIVSTDLGVSGATANNDGATGLFLNSGNVFGGGSPSTYNSGVFRSVAVGGEGLTVKTSETAYANQISLQPSGNNFDGLLVPPTLTADRSYSFQDASGTVAFLSDITTFTGNTSATCISDLYITNLYGCSPITIHDNLVPDLNNDKDLGAPSFRWREIYTTNIDVTNAATIGYLYVNNFSNFYNDVNITGSTIIDGGLTATTGLFSSSTDNVLTVIGSGSTNTDPLFKVRGSNSNLLTISDSLFGSIFLVNDVSGLPILEVDATTGATDYFYVNANSEFNGNVSITGNTTIDGDLIVTGVTSASTINITTTPTNNNSLTEILGRNSSTGEIEYISSTELGVDTFVTAFTYNNLNKLTLSRNEGQSDLDVRIDVMSGLTINGGLTATTGLFSSSTDNVLRVIGSGGTDTEPLFAIEGSSGELFSVTDSLEGSLFSVNDISGLPIFDVNSDKTILMGDIAAPSLNTTTKDVISTGSTNLYSIPISAYTGGFFDYTAVGNGGARSGNIISIWSGTTTQFNEITTNDIGSSTSGLSFNVFVSGGSAILSASATTGSYTIKTIVRGI